MKLINRKGMAVPEWLVAAIIVIIVVLIVVSSLIGKGIPEIMHVLTGFSDETQSFMDGLTGYGKDKALEEKKAKLLEDFNSLVGAYRECNDSPNTGCTCLIWKGNVFDEDFFITLQQIGEKKFLAIPYSKGIEGNALVLDNPVELEGDVCFISASDKYLNPNSLPILTLGSKGPLENIRMYYEGGDFDVYGFLYKQTTSSGNSVCIVQAGASDNLLKGASPESKQCKNYGECVITETYWSRDGKSFTSEGDFTNFMGKEVFIVIKGVGCDDRVVTINVYGGNQIVKTLQGQENQKFSNGIAVSSYELPVLDYNTQFTFDISVNPLPFTRASGPSAFEKIFVHGNKCELKNVYWSDADGNKVVGGIIFIGKDAEGPYYMTAEGENCEGKGVAFTVGYLINDEPNYIPSYYIYHTFEENKITAEYEFYDGYSFEEGERYIFKAAVDKSNSGKVASRDPGLVVSSDDALVVEY